MLLTKIMAAIAVGVLFGIGVVCLYAVALYITGRMEDPGCTDRSPKALQSKGLTTAKQRKIERPII